MRIKHWLYAVCVSVGVLVACWVAADRTATSLVGDKLAQSVDAGQTVADRVADGMIHAINTDLAMVRAIPSTLAEVDLLRDVLRGKPVQWVAARDIGVAAAAFFRDPQAWAGRAVGVVSGHNYSSGDDVRLTVYAPAGPGQRSIAR